MIGSFFLRLGQERTTYQVGGYTALLDALGWTLNKIVTVEKNTLKEHRAVDYVADSQGTEMNYRVMSEVVSRYRQEGKIEEEDLDKIRKS